MTYKTVTNGVSTTTQSGDITPVFLAILFVAAVMLMLFVFTNQRIVDLQRRVIILESQR